MKGFFNRILYINLSKKTYTYQPVSDEILKNTLGGKGLGTYLLQTENPKKVKPLSPENRLIITTGPATGTKLWSQSRFGVFSKSPATGGYAESYCGGSLAPKIKGCGIDAVVIHGKCDALSFLMIDEYGVTFKNAFPIRGMDSYQSEEYILSHSGKGAGAMVIGPGGESLVNFACIKSDRWRSAGRCGLGAVMGAKNLKGISFYGVKKTEIFDEDLLKQTIKNIANKAKDLPATKMYRKYGTAMGVKLLNSVNGFPTRYWQSGYFDKWENISADYLVENFDVKPAGCPTCFVKCTNHSTVKQGRHKGLVIEGPEYETLYSFGGLNEIDSLEEIAYLNDLCDRLGLDTMSAGNITAFAIEAKKRNKIDFDIDYNQPDNIAKLIKLIAMRKEIGDIFADGIVSASQKLGLEDIAVHVKGLEPAGYEPRVLPGMGLSYATSARGACHLRGTFYKAELSGKIDRKQIEGKARMQIDYEDRSALFDCLILCRFYRDIILWDELRDIFKALTGLDYSKEELEIIANEITQQTRKYNQQEGLGAETDTLPKWITRHKTQQGDQLTEEQLNIMLKEYNEIRNERTR